MTKVKQQQIGIVPITKSNRYQEILSSIGLDIRNKHRRRIQRRAEIRALNKTIDNLHDKMKYLSEESALMNPSRTGLICG